MTTREVRLRHDYVFMGLLAAAGCYDSHALEAFTAVDEPADESASEPTCPLGERFPDEVVGSFALVGSGGRCLGGGTLDVGIGPCGSAVIYTGEEGRARRIGADYLIEVRGVPAFTLRPADERWAGRAVLLARVEFEPHDGEFRYWAVRFEERPAPPVPVPNMTACLIRESWSIHEADGAELGPPLLEGTETVPEDAWLGDPTNFPLVARLGEGGAFITNEGRLPFCVTGRCDGAFGRFVEWNGTSGVAYYQSSAGLCSEWDGEVEVELVDEVLLLHHDWWVLDVDDADRDGNREERLIRRTRSELVQESCPAL